MVGARYCSRPSVVIGIRIAAAPKQISGTAVTMPVRGEQQRVAGAVAGERATSPVAASQTR